MESNKKVLVGTVGYHLLTNHSVGPMLLPALKKLSWPAGVCVDELNWGPIAIVQQLEALPTPYDRVVLLTAVERAGRQTGDITIFQWQGGLPGEKQIQACVGDAATGVISVDNLLIIGEYFKIWPKEVYLVDVEPGREQPGEHLTAGVAAKVPEILKTVQRLAVHGLDRRAAISFLQGNKLFEEVKHGG